MKSSILLAILLLFFSYSGSTSNISNVLAEIEVASSKETLLTNLDALGFGKVITLRNKVQLNQSLNTKAQCEAITKQFLQFAVDDVRADAIVVACAKFADERLPNLEKYLSQKNIINRLITRENLRKVYRSSCSREVFSYIVETLKNDTENDVATAMISIVCGVKDLLSFAKDFGDVESEDDAKLHLLMMVMKSRQTWSEKFKTLDQFASKFENSPELSSTVLQLLRNNVEEACLPLMAKDFENGLFTLKRKQFFALRDESISFILKLLTDFISMNNNESADLIFYKTLNLALDSLHPTAEARLQTYLKYLIAHGDRMFVQKAVQEIPVDDFSHLLLSLLKFRAERNLDDDAFGMAVHAVIAKIYEQNFPRFSTMIYVDPFLQPRNEGERLLQKARPMKIICNHEGFSEHFQSQIAPFIIEHGAIIGAPLKTHDDTPVGYNIHLPQGEVKAIFVVVYGGGGGLYVPGDLDDFYQHLLHNNYAVVTLHLADKHDVTLREVRFNEYDFFWREQRYSQHITSPELHDLIHNGIQQFFEVITTNPQQLHESLNVLDGKKAVLFGSSFGGRTVLRHAELYAGRSFSSYLSYSAGVNFPIGEKCCSPICLPIKKDLVKTYGDELLKASSYLDPFPFLGDITERVLLVHPSDDNQVSIATSLSCYKKLAKADKSRVKFFSFLHGAPSNKNSPHNHKGHHLPKDVDTLVELGEVFTNFIDDVYEPAEASELRALRARVHAYRYLRNAKPEQKFISATYRRWSIDSTSTLPKDEEWQADYVPMHKVFWALEQLKQQTDFAKTIMEAITLNLTPEMIERGICSHAHLFATFINETIDLQYDEKHMRDAIITNKGIRTHFANWIALPTSDEDFPRIYALTTLLEANPHLLVDVVVPNADELLRSARLKFEKLIKKEMSLVEKIEASLKK